MFKKILSVLLVLSMIFCLFACNQSTSDGSAVGDNNSKAKSIKNSINDDLVIYRKEDGNVYFSNFSDIPETFLMEDSAGNILDCYLDLINNYIIVEKNVNSDRKVYAKSLKNLERTLIEFEIEFDNCDNFGNVKFDDYNFFYKNNDLKMSYGPNNAIVYSVNYKTGRCELDGCEDSMIKEKTKEMGIKNYNVYISGDTRYLIAKIYENKQHIKDELYHIDGKGNFKLLDEQTITIEEYEYSYEDHDLYGGKNVKKISTNIRTGIFIEGNDVYQNGECYYIKYTDITDEYDKNDRPLRVGECHYCDKKNNTVLISDNSNKLSAKSYVNNSSPFILPFLALSNVKCYFYKSNEIECMRDLSISSSAEPIYIRGESIYYKNNKIKKYCKYDINKNKTIEICDIGGGFGVCYNDGDHIIYIAYNTINTVYFDDDKTNMQSADTNKKFYLSNDASKVLYGTNSRYNEKLFLYDNEEEIMISPQSYKFCFTNADNIIFNENNNIYIYKDDTSSKIIDNTELCEYALIK